MSWLDAFLTAVKALKTNILRSVLTTLGIIIGVGAVIIMIAVGQGAEARMEQLISSLGSNLLLVLPGSTSTGGVRLGRGSKPSLTEADARAIEEELEEVRVAAPSVRGGAQVVFGNQNWSTMVYGITPGFMIAREWEVASGRGLTDAEVKGSAKSVLLGQSVVEALFPDQEPLGQIIRINRAPFEVVGVLAEKGETAHGSDQDDTIFVPLTTAKKRVIGGRKLSGNLVSVIWIKAWSADLVGLAEENTKALLRQRHRLRRDEDDDFYVRNLSQILEARAESSRAMSLLLAAVAGVSLLVGGIGIMNIMLVSVTERTREIGLRMAVGARRGDILSQFLIESVVLSLIGGLIGAALGVGGALAIASAGQWPAVLNFKAVGLAFGFAALVGVFFGFYPARKASRLDPIDALRYE